MKTLDQLVMRLECIAAKNNDRFQYKITIEPYTKGMIYCFSCEETCDNHTIVRGRGNTIEEAANQAWNNIESSFKDWGYENAWQEG